MHELCITEFGLLVQDDSVTNSLRIGHISHPAAWEFLELLAFSREKEDRFIKPASYNGKKALRVVNFVGVITTPDGTQIEILPKTSEVGQDSGATRRLLWKMLGKAEGLHFLQTTASQLQVHEMRLPEALISVFLEHVAALRRRGIQRNYHHVTAQEPFVRGRLRITEQMRQPPGQEHLFQIEYDLFSENRAENRLLVAALARAARWASLPDNQRLSKELLAAFDGIPLSSSFKQDFNRWSTSRDMIYYQPLLPWIRLILNEQSPFTLKGQHAGISFLFPMEKLFEKYVARALESHLQPLGLTIKSQLQEQYLSHSPRAFMLKPDAGIYCGNRLIVLLDTKWKLLDENAVYNSGDDDPKAGIAQSDMYQLFAYGRKYFDKAGRLALLYPRWNKFKSPLPPFDLGNALMLHALPFDMNCDDCVGLGTILADVTNK